jgi:hypothetical protein
VTLELGRTGSTGIRGETPVLRDGAVVATMRASQWKEAATAVIGGREWVFSKHHRVLLGRWTADPEGTSRLSARPASFWRGTWIADLEGTAVERQRVSRWRSIRHYVADGREVARSGNAGRWSSRPRLTADESLPLHQQVFLLWLELVIRRRDQAAVAGATSAAVIGGTT